MHDVVIAGGFGLIAALFGIAGIAIALFVFRLPATGLIATSSVLIAVLGFALRNIIGDILPHSTFEPEDLERERYEALRAGMPPKYGGRCRGLSKDDARRRLQNGETAVVRFRVPEEPRDIGWEDVVRGPVSFRSDVIGDFVLLRSDGVPAYNFAVVIDDALMAITHVVRGEDHISNTPRQVLLYEAFGWRPPTFAHVSMVLGPDHSKLSKRHGAVSVMQYDEDGFLPEALFNYLARLGWSHGDVEKFSREQLAGWKKQPGMKGVRFTFHTEVLRAPLLDGRFDWVWGELEKHGIPAMVLFHHEYMHLADKVAERYPGLRLVLDRLGNAMGAEDQFGVARMTVRQALGQLVFENLIVRQPGMAQGFPDRVISVL